MRGRQGYVYMLANKPAGTIYIGVTSDLLARVGQHKAKTLQGFTARYGVDRLVYFEVADDMESAIHREKALKKWKRSWKIALIEGQNPKWADLYEGLMRAEHGRAL